MDPPIVIGGKGRKEREQGSEEQKVASAQQYGCPRVWVAVLQQDANGQNGYGCRE